MGEGLPYADIVLLALIAGFILLRLRSVLGNKTGNDNANFFKRDAAESAREKDTASPKIVQLSEKSLKAKTPLKDDDSYSATITNDAIARTITQIKDKDPLFNATSFLSGAKMAYEMVFDAFAKGDKTTLEMLLDKPIYTEFASEIDARQSQDTTTEITLVSVKPKDIVSAILTGTIARIGVKFDSEQVVLSKNKAGSIVEGDPSHAHLMDDEWLFERDISSKNPNWKIIET